MAIHYSLLVINRFREELRAGRPTDQAVARTLASAGRTVFVSGVLVILSLASLLIFPEVFLRSMALGGMAAGTGGDGQRADRSAGAVGDAGTADQRANGARAPWRPHAPARISAEHSESGAWARLARPVMRRPTRYATAVLLALVFLALPLLHVRFGSVDERVLPERRSGPDGGRTRLDRVRPLRALTDLRPAPGRDPGTSR